MNDHCLPDGSPFPFWDDATRYRRVLHVARDHPRADDANPGTEAAPLATIGAAARLLQPGEKAVIHAGCYRETVRPARGGTGPDAMIAYEAAPGEEVVVTGAEEVEPAARPSKGWRIPTGPAAAAVWMMDLPETLFIGYNPFAVRNTYEYLFQYGQTQDAEWMKRVLLRRGSVLYRGRPLRQVLFARDLAGSDGVFWVEEPGLRIHFRLPGDAGPGEALEVTAREQTFAPAQTGLGYIRVSGLTLRQAADGLPVPQRGSLSTGRGHHWIIENCTVDGANGVGISLGAQSWDGCETEDMGHHIVRRNRIRNCGVCGIAGARGVFWSLLERNCFESIGYQDLERMWECAAIKFHFARNCLIRGNIFRHIRHAGGVWLDVDNVNNRITGNLFADIETLTGAVYSEMNYERNLIDHNILWNIRGTAVNADCNESVVVAHNLIGEVPEGGAVLCTLGQARRKSGGRTGLCRANQVLNNVIVRCPRRVEFGRREENVSDGNLFDAADDNCSFHIAYPEPGTYQNLASWQTYFGLDHHSSQAPLNGSFEADTLELSLRPGDAQPACVASDLLSGGLTHPEPGPFTREQWETLRRGDSIRMDDHGP